MKHAQLRTFLFPSNPPNGLGWWIHPHVVRDPGDYIGRHRATEQHHGCPIL
jgi:hypothetical protein